MPSTCICTYLVWIYLMMWYESCERHNFKITIASTTRCCFWWMLEIVITRVGCLTPQHLDVLLPLVLSRLIKGILSCRAPMSFFHTTPMGRIINRLTKDTADTDKNLGDFAGFFLRNVLQLISTIVLIAVVTPFALCALVPIILCFYLLYAYFQVLLPPPPLPRPN